MDILAGEKNLKENEVTQRGENDNALYLKRLDNFVQIALTTDKLLSSGAALNVYPNRNRAFGHTLIAEIFY